MLLRSSFLLGFLALLCLPAPASAQEPPLDAAQLSAELLYHPALHIERDGETMVFRAPRFTYRRDAAGAWHVVKEENNVEPLSFTRYVHAPTGNEFHFRGTSTSDDGILEIRRGGPGGQPAASLVLWTRDRLAELWLPRLKRDNPQMTLDDLHDDLEPADPDITGIAELNGQVWLAVRFYAGEGVLGMGTLVRFDPGTAQAELVQPASLAHSSFSHIVAAGNVLWLGTEHEGEGFLESTEGLVRFDPATGEVKSFRTGAQKIAGHIVTALHASNDELWVATDEGLCRLAPPAETAECWRIVPKVTLAAATPVSNHPAGPPRGRLPAGSYEARWSTMAWLEVVTPDAMEGWLETDDLEEYRRRDFDRRGLDLSNVYGGGAGVMRLLAEPKSNPLEAAQAYRVPVETLGAPNEAGWVRVRARVGWIPRGKLEIIPAIEPARP